jgi:hypothetical protein
MSRSDAEPPGPDSSTDAGDVDQDSEPSNTAPPGGAPNDPSDEDPGPEA